MTVFGKVFVALWAFAIMAAAVPMNRLRDVSMVTETAYTTVDVAVTLMVDENGVPFETVGPTNVAPVATTTMATVTTPATSVATPSSAPAQSQQVAATPDVPSPLPSTTPVMVTTTPVVAAAAPAAPSTSSVAAAPPAPAAPTNPASGGSSDASGISASSTNGCTGKSDACSGDITHYDGGEGACGGAPVNTDTDMAIALPWEFMGTESNNNPYCGKTLTIHNPNTGLEIQATVRDKCMGCSGRSIDLTNAAFNAIAPTCDGRCSGFIWWFN